MPGLGPSVTTTPEAEGRAGGGAAPVGGRWSSAGLPAPAASVGERSRWRWRQGRQRTAQSSSAMQPCPVRSPLWPTVALWWAIRCSRFLSSAAPARRCAALPRCLGLLSGVRPEGLGSMPCACTHLHSAPVHSEGQPHAAGEPTRDRRQCKGPGWPSALLWSVASAGPPPSPGRLPDRAATRPPRAHAPQEVHGRPGGSGRRQRRQQQRQRGGGGGGRRQRRRRCCSAGGEKAEAVHRSGDAEGARLPGRPQRAVCARQEPRRRRQLGLVRSLAGHGRPHAVAWLLLRAPALPDTTRPPCPAAGVRARSTRRTRRQRRPLKIGRPTGRR